MNVLLSSPSKATRGLLMTGLVILNLVQVTRKTSEQKIPLQVMPKATTDLICIDPSLQQVSIGSGAQTHDELAARS
ncbi:hypothetical protein TNCV_1781571 [Trichonephila clavipes]|nr:hypothetical protein TNCV_1781571 [Trichonephila clavipes]